MQAVDVGGKQFFALASGPVHAVLDDGVGVAGDGVESGKHLLWDDRAAHGGEFLDLGDVGDRHDAGNDGHRDADFPAAFDEAEEAGVVEEQLSDDEVGARIDFFPQPAKVSVEVRCLWMFLRIAGAAEAEAVAELFADVADQVDGVVEVGKPAFRRFGQAGGTVATQGEDVFDAVFGEILQRAINVIESLANAGEMRHRFKAELLFDLERDFERAGAGRASGAVGAGGERRAKFAQVRERFQQRGHSFVVLGREELEGDCGSRGFENVADFHGML